MFRHLLQTKVLVMISLLLAEGTHHRTVTPGALYDPRILPDYRGTYFQLRQNKLKQLNIYDTTENGLKLVPMHETYSKLRPGTLVLAVCDAHVYNMVQNGNPTSVRSRQHQQKKKHADRTHSDFPIGCASHEGSPSL